MFFFNSLNIKVGVMRGNFKFVGLFAILLAILASCTPESEVVPNDVQTLLVNKTWYKHGKSGEVWVLFERNGRWSNSSGDEGSWTFVDKRIIEVNAQQDLLGRWEEEVLEISDDYLKTKVKGVAFATEYSTAP